MIKFCPTWPRSHRAEMKSLIIELSPHGSLTIGSNTKRSWKVLANSINEANLG